MCGMSHGTLWEGGGLCVLHYPCPYPHPHAKQAGGGGGAGR